MKHNIFNEWNDDPATDLSAVHNWLESDTWNNICEHAELGDRDSIEVMEQVHLMLSSLIHHMKIDDNHAKVQYELNLFNELLNNYK